MHIVFCTVCKYVLSICKLFCFFALFGARSQEFHSPRHLCCGDVTIKVIWFDLKQSWFKHLWELHKEWTEARVSASRVTTLRRLQEKGYQATSEPETTSEASYLGCGEKELDCCSVVLFSDESKFCISFGNQGPRVWRKSGEAHNPYCLKSSVKFPQSVMIWAAMSSAGVGPLCFLSPQSTQPSTRKF